MTPSVAAVLTAAGAAVAVGGAGAVVVHRVGRRSPVWAAALAPVTAVLSIAAGIAAASAMMLLAPDQVRIVVLVLAVAVPIAVGFGVLLARQAAHLQQEADRERADRERDAAVEERRRELISWLSHDLRSPLARMRVMTEAAEDGLAPPDHSRRLLDEIAALSRIVDDIATLSRLNGAVALAPQPTDLADLASDAVAADRPLADSLDVRLVLESGSAAPMVADPAELARALHNLIGNALRHTAAGGSVSVAVSRQAGEAVVVVRDECGGIPEDQLPRLFEPGWRGTAARTPGDGGAGLGLAIADSVVAAHGGVLEVANQGPGCAFTMRLPSA